MGIVVPDPEVMPAWAQKRGIEGTYVELCANKVCALGCFLKGGYTFYNEGTEKQQTSEI